MTTLPSPASSARCPGCDRYVGPVRECPYCGVDIPGRLSLRLLRVCALVFGIGGLAALFVAARHTELPLVKVSEIAPSMNYGRVRIQGRVVSVPRVFDRGGRPDYLSFDVDDGSGRVTVAASRRAARRLVTENRLPAKGVRVEAAGNLSVGPERRPRLYLDVPSQLKSLDAAPSPDLPESRGAPPPETKGETS